ncbi:extensin family protein [Mesorhizobium sp. 1B3]|uniref:extensin-like domain-containing protein n=1 Tax=Mesorhizobium sp. 1B3 TaxID=3243599 RepID=UPI003D97FD81
MAAVASRCRRLPRKPILLSLAIGLAVISACSTDNVLSLRPEVDVGVTTAALPGGVSNLAPPAPVPTYQARTPPSAEPAPAIAEPALTEPALVETVPVVPDSVEPAPITPQLVGYPHVDDPTLSPRMTPAEPNIMPADEVSCRQELKRLGVRYEELPPIDDGGLCAIDHPVKVSAIGNVQVKPAATLRCEMAATIALWTRRELIPAARTRYFSGVKTIHQGSSYSCRRIRGTRTASEHSKGNALDIMRVELKNGRDIDVRKPGWFAFRQRGFLNSVRADGCDYFTTVLGPGYDHDHRDHFHFDIKERRNGYRACR